MSQDSGFFIALARASDSIAPGTALVGLSAPAWVGALQHISADAAILLPLVTLVWLLLQLALKIIELFTTLRTKQAEDPPDPPPHHQ